jgi:hypothetical protein
MNRPHKLALRFVLLAARREIEEGVVSDEAKDREDQSEINKLIRLAERAAAEEPDPVRGFGRDHRDRRGKQR